jgi:AAA15 family ATPase/GTPase
VHVFLDFVEQHLSVLLSPLVIESMTFAFQHENILLIDNNYTLHEIYLLSDNHHLVDKQNQLSKNEKIRSMKNKRRNQHTPSFTAFRRKKALHGAQVGTAKLIPIATPPHTEHGPRFRGITFPFI